MSATWDQKQFNATLKEYMKRSSRNFTTIINTKAYYIARKAVWFTAKADAPRIKGQLGAWVKVNRINKKGKLTTKRVLNLVQGTQHNSPLAALIINARRGKDSKPGLYGAAMARAIREMLGARLKSVAFIKSGWLPAIRALAPLADRRGQPHTDPSAKQVGRPKGTAKPARGVFKVLATIVNNASPRKDKKNALVRWGSRGLQRAFDDETKSMRQYIDDKMKSDTAAANKKL